MNTTNDLVAESNRIENILRDPTPEECEEFERFTDLIDLTLDDFRKFVDVNAPGHRLRNQYGWDVRVGRYIAPRAGPVIEERLLDLIKDANLNQFTPWQLHVAYERLHPFTDGNGRSGRALWYWAMRRQGHWDYAQAYGFLHYFYYQTLREAK